ncbi:enolase [Nematocida displodere]|uniref:phosphopyruvate hydratase n=1 Tax=Nematocida displodere TaxID=1805483 RepID=A0A177EIW1_9MICR|nr:enolase [Nematocida displodere]
MKVRECVKKLKGRTIFDSRGVPTTEVHLESAGCVFTSSCPSGASTGSQEALELRDHNESVCRGKGVAQAVASIDTLSKALLSTDLEVEDLPSIDKFMCDQDGTENKSNLGANAILPLSMSFARLGASLAGQPLWEYLQKFSGAKGKTFPKIFFNLINGGAHSDNGLFVQEIMVSFPGSTPLEVFSACSTFSAYLKEEVRLKYGMTGVGDEGGFAPPLASLEDALELVASASRTAGIHPTIALDAAASEFATKGEDVTYNIGWKTEKERVLTRKELIEYYTNLIAQYKISMIEDPFDEKDYASWEEFLPIAESMGVQVVGDDLIVTNPELIKQAGEKKWCNVALIKMNQIGTITETIQAMKEARAYGMTVMTSHRSGETEDVFLTHLTLGIGAEYIKSGALCRSERVAKYNEFLRLFED